MHTLVGAGKADGAMDAKYVEACSRKGKLHCVGATTLNEYRQFVEKDVPWSEGFKSAD